MLPEFYSNYFEPSPREFEEFEPYQIVPTFNAQGQIPVQTQQQNQQSAQQPVQQPTNFPSNFELAPGSPTMLGVEYTQGFLRTQIGKRMRITFLIGTNQIQDRSGTLTDVGISYIIIRDLDTTTSTLCDIYAIKFVTIFP